MSLLRFSLASLLSACAFLGVSYAQPPQPLPVPRNVPHQPLQTQQPNAQQAPAQTFQGTTTVNKPVTSSNADQTIATMLSICNQKESQLGLIAKQHSQNSKVKDFAEMMTRDHSEMVKSLQRFGANPGLVTARLTGTSRQSESDTTNSAQTDDPAQNPISAQQQPSQKLNQQQTTQPNRTQPMHAGGLDFVSIHSEIANRCLSEADKEWKDKSPECDMGYIGQQIVAHKEMIVSAKVLRQNASPELQKVIDQGVTAAETHLGEAKKLIETLAKEEHKQLSQSTD